MLAFKTVYQRQLKLDRQLDELKMRFLALSLRRKFESSVFASQWDDVGARINAKCRGNFGDYKNKQILSIKNFMSELVIFNLTFLCHRFRLFLAVKIFSKALFYHRFRVFLAVSFWNKKFRSVCRDISC